MKFIKILVPIIVSSILNGCSNQKTVLEIVLEEAGQNRLELLKVINHYRNVDNKDSLKLQAALFLIENMPGHGTIWSENIERFRNLVNSSDTLIHMELMNNWWDSLNRKYHTETIFKEDSKKLTASFLINNIDKAFQVWETSPWKGEIDFNTFCKYILPYRFQTELLTEGWRDSLYNMYFPLVKNAQTLKQAFEIVHDTIWKRLLSSSSHFPYSLDAIAMQHQRKASCIQRCIMLGSVMRALGIPTAIDNIGRWANYSKNGHAWVSLITNKGTYSIFEDEFEAKINNRIDATLFEVKYPIDKDYLLYTDFKKRYAKIWRLTYERNIKEIKTPIDWEVAQQLNSPFILDISKEYGLNNEVEIQTELPVKYAYLCTFATGLDWMPISFSKIKNGKCKFSALGDSVVFLAMGCYRGEIISLGNPFLLYNHKKIDLDPFPTKLQTLVLSRKYPLIGKWMNEWAPMVGGRFEGSSDSSFINSEILSTIDSMPIFRNIIKLKTNKSYRYVRYVSEKTCDTPMAEIEFYADETKLTVKPGKSTVAHVEYSIDGNTFTRPDIENGYCLGYDLGHPKKLSSIVYFPWNDDNFILPNHTYELFYYNKKWKSLGKKESNDYFLLYEDVPINALLYLKDYTKGHEERPFTYENGKQIWW